MERTNVDGGGKLEASYGYSRAVRVGNIIRVAGTCATDENGKPFAVGDPAGQAVRCFEVIGAALRAVGADLGNIVATRIYLKDINDAEAVGLAHGQLFQEVKPACTMIGGAALVHDDFLVEIECEAVAVEGAA